MARQPLHKRHHFDTSWSIHMQKIGVQCLSRSDFPASCFHSFSQTAEQPVNELYRSLITVTNYSAKQQIVLWNVKIHYRVLFHVIYHFCCTTNLSHPFLLFAVKINEDRVKSGYIVSILTDFLCRHFLNTKVYKDTVSNFGNETRRLTDTIAPFYIQRIHQNHYHCRKPIGICVVMDDIGTPICHFYTDLTTYAGKVFLCNCTSVINANTLKVKYRPRICKVGNISGLSFRRPVRWQSCHRDHKMGPKLQSVKSTSCKKTNGSVVTKSRQFVSVFSNQMHHHKSKR